MKLKLKEIKWIDLNEAYIAYIMGIELSIQLNTFDKYDIALVNPFAKRGEYEKSFATLEQAKDYAVNVMLKKEIVKYFEVIL